MYKYKIINGVIIVIAVVILVVALNAINNENELILLQIQETELNLKLLEKKMATK
jgi:hypothetical protein